MDNVADNNTKRRRSETAATGSKKSCTDNADSTSVALDIVTARCVQYLGVRSLVRFGATNKSNKAVVDNEVERRKKEIADIEKELKRLMGADHGKSIYDDGHDGAENILLSSVPIARANMTKAITLSNHALRMIDDEIDFQWKLGTKEMGWDVHECDDVDWLEYDVFLEERKKFRLDSCTPFGSLLVLPECFYCPPEGDASKPSDELIKKAQKKAFRVWGAEDHMQSVYEWGMDDPDWYMLNYEQPFRKFGMPGAGFFNEYVCDTALDLAGRGTPANKMEIEAFRIAARKVVFTRPGSRDCLWYTITKADEFFKEAVEHVDSETLSDCSE